VKDSEIALVDYLDVLWRWRVTVLIGTIAAILLGFVLAPARPARVTAKVSILVGDLSDQQVKAVDRLVANALATDADRGLAARFEPPMRLDVEATASSEEQAKEVLDRAVDRFMADLSRFAQSRSARLEELKRRERELTVTIEKLRLAQTGALERSDVTGAVLLGVLSSELGRAETQLTQIQSRLETAATAEPVRLRTIVAPVPRASRLLVTLIAGVAGFLAAGAMTLLLDYAAGARRRTAEGARQSRVSSVSPN
jgi:hypothetical protein